MRRTVSRRAVLAGASVAVSALPILPLKPVAAAASTSSYPGRGLDALAISLFNAPVVQSAMKQGEDLLKLSPKGVFENEVRLVPDAVSALFFSAAQTVANDPFAPHLHWFMARHHSVAGIDVPDARGTVENPDNYYRFFPVNPALRYRITGRHADVRPTATTYSLVTELVAEASAGARTAGFLSDKQLESDADGRFALTIGPEATEGRINHIQMQRDARMLLVRDTLADWASQLPSALKVECVYPAAAPPPLSFNAMALRASGMGLRAVQTWGLDFPRFDYDAIPPNTMGPMLVSSKRSGGLVSQMSSHGLFELQDDEALVVTIPALDVAYRGFELADIWMRSAEYATKTGSLNGNQVVPNGDGSITYVISPRDPGVHNWANPGPIRRGSITARAQGFRTAVSESLPIEARMVELSDLRNALPKGMAFMTPEGRRNQLATRLANYERRLSALLYADQVDDAPRAWFNYSKSGRKTV